MGFQVLGIDHAVLRVHDLHRMVRFYGEVLGCPVDHRQQSLGLVHLRAGTSLIDLVQALPGEPPWEPSQGRLAHLCLRIEPWDEAALRTHLAIHGVEAEWATANYGAEGIGPAVYLRDPDGNVLELKGPAGLRIDPKVD